MWPTQISLLLLLLPAWQRGEEAVNNINRNENHLRAYKRWEAVYGKLPDQITMGMSRLVNPSNKEDWLALRTQIAQEHVDARMSSDASANVLVEECDQVYHMAVSYRHDFLDKSARPKGQPRLTMTEARWETLRLICEKQTAHRKKSKLRIWFDQILAARLAPIQTGGQKAAATPVDAGGAKWIVNGLLPYTLLQVAFVPSYKGVTDDFERMWIVVEQLLATLSSAGVVTVDGSVMCRKLETTWTEIMGLESSDQIPYLWNSIEIQGLSAEDVALNVEMNGCVFGAGNLPLDALTHLARALLSGALDTCKCFHMADYCVLKQWAAQLASIERFKMADIAEFCTSGIAPDNLTLSYNDLRVMIKNLGENKRPGEGTGPNSANRFRPATVIVASAGEWDGIYEWLPGAKSFLSNDRMESWHHLYVKDYLEAKTRWVMYFHEFDTDEQRIFAVGRLESPLGGTGSYISVELCGGSKPFGCGAKVIRSQLGWPPGTTYENDFLYAFAVYKFRVPWAAEDQKETLERFWNDTLLGWPWWTEEGAAPFGVESTCVTELYRFGAIRGPEVRWGLDASSLNTC